jgi:hypothetical protein
VEALTVGATCNMVERIEGEDAAHAPSCTGTMIRISTVNHACSLGFNRGLVCVCPHAAPDLNQSSVPYLPHSNSDCWSPFMSDSAAWATQTADPGTVRRRAHHQGTQTTGLSALSTSCPPRLLPALLPLPTCATA